MLRTALGESTASLDSTTRSGLQTHYFLGGKQCPALNPVLQMPGLPHLPGEGVLSVTAVDRAPEGWA